MDGHTDTRGQDVNVEDNRCNLLSWGQPSTWEQKMISVITGEAVMRCVKLVQRWNVTFCDSVTSSRLQAGPSRRAGFEFRALTALSVFFHLDFIHIVFCALLRLLEFWHCFQLQQGGESQSLVGQMVLVL